MNVAHSNTGIPSLICRHRHIVDIQEKWKMQYVYENENNNNWTLAASMVKWPTIICYVCWTMNKMHGKSVHSFGYHLSLLFFLQLDYFGSIGYCLLLTGPSEIPLLMFGLRVCLLCCASRFIAVFQHKAINRTQNMCFSMISCCCFYNFFFFFIYLLLIHLRSLPNTLFQW